MTLLKSSLETLHSIVQEEIKARGGGSGLNAQYLMEQIKMLREQVIEVRKQQERILSTLAKLDEEVIRSHHRLDLARDAVVRLQGNATQGKEASHVDSDSAS